MLGDTSTGVISCLLSIQISREFSFFRPGIAAKTLSSSSGLVREYCRSVRLGRVQILGRIESILLKKLLFRSSFFSFCSLDRSAGRDSRELPKRLSSSSSVNSLSHGSRLSNESISENSRFRDFRLGFCRRSRGTRFIIIYILL